MKENTNLSLQLLLLNDLLRANVIEKEIYDQAAQKLKTVTKEKQVA